MLDGEGNAVMFDDNNDDFQLPDNFDNMVNVAADRVLSLRHVYYPNKQEREKKKDFEEEAWSISVNSTIDSPSSQ